MDQPLRISIPAVDFCVTDECVNYVSTYSFYRVCLHCIRKSNPGMSQQVTAAALARKSELVHRAPLSGASCRLRKIY
jgi:hypothetical protein